MINISKENSSYAFLSDYTVVLSRAMTKCLKMSRKRDKAINNQTNWFYTLFYKN